mgnify:FL=1
MVFSPMTQALPLSPEGRQGSRPGRSASLNRSQWTHKPDDTPTSHRPSRRRSEQSITRNRSQISLRAEEVPGERPAGQTSIQRSASAFPLGSRGSRQDSARRPSTESFRPPPRRSSEASTTASGASKGFSSARVADGLEKGPELTTASAAKRVVAALGPPAGTAKSLSRLDDWLESCRRHRREAPTQEAYHGFRPSAEDRAGVATHCWFQERKGSKWLGPPAPPRALNRTLHRGSQALPSGPMSLRQEQPTSSEYGKAYSHKEWSRAGVPSPHDLNRAIAREGLFGRGTEALPHGPMFLDGTTTHDYGKMYRKRD